jgi:O-acetyl-ADP-ribose deacetylase (regulator of RNase III)
VLKEISRAKYRSALIPIFGTGHAGFAVLEVAPRLVQRALAFFKENPKSALKEVYFLAYSEGDLDVLERAIEDHSGFKPVGAEPQA